MSDFNGQLPARRTLWGHAVTASRLKPTSKLVALVLMTYMDTKATCFPSVKTIARAASVSDRTINRAIPTIEAAGLLVVSRNQNRRGNEYLGTIPEHYWGIWEESFVEDLVDKMILGWDEDRSNGVTVVAVYDEPARPGENSVKQTRNGVTSGANGVMSDANGDSWERNSDTAVSPEVVEVVDEVAEAESEGPESLGGGPEIPGGDEDFVEILPAVADEEQALR